MVTRVKRSTITDADLEAFRNECIHARAVFVHYRSIFESVDPPILKTIAPIFFGDAARVFQLYLIGEVCKLTDPAGIARKNENLTVDRLMKDLRTIKATETRKRLQTLAEGLHAFRKKVKPARDKYGSHIDLSSIRRGQRHGAADDASWTRFWQDLDEFVFILSSDYLNQPVHINDLPDMSDAQRVIAALTKAAAGD
jgi:hypothetical protein